MHCRLNGLGSSPCVEQRQPRQQQRRRCFRWLQPCIAGSLSSAQLSDEREIQSQEQETTCPQQDMQFSISLEVDSPSEKSPIPGRAPTAPWRRRKLRGYRVFYRPTSAAGNYYALPFPPPESLKLECDGDGKVWQDLEVRVISHEGLVVWQDLQTLSGHGGNAAAGNKGALQQGRKFHRTSRAYRRPQLSPPNPPPPPLLLSSGSLESSQIGALLSIEATINLRPNVPELRALQPPLAPYGLVNIETSTLSNTTDSCVLEGDRKSVSLLRQLRQMQLIQHIQRTERMQQIHHSQRAQQAQQLMKLRQNQLQWSSQQTEPPKGKPGQPVSREVTQRSRIPRLLPNWSQQMQPRQRSPELRQRQLEFSQRPRKQSSRLKVQHDLRLQLLWQRRQAATTTKPINYQLVGNKRDQLPSYMRPYSPVLHYPAPSKLPVPIRSKTSTAFCDFSKSQASDSCNVWL